APVIVSQAKNADIARNGIPAESPLWAAHTALTLMLSIGWKPESNQDWCGMSALIFRANRTLPLEQLVASLPDSIDR
ncbi:hypothetical protein ACSQ97_22550, partial [Salmonella enterica]